MRSPSLVEGSTQSDSKMRMDDSEMGSDIPTGPRKRLAMDDPSFAESRNVLDVPSRPRAMRIRGAARNAGVSPRTDGQAADNKANGLSIFGRAGVPDPHAPAFVPGARGAPNSVSDVDVNAGVGGFGQSAVASPSFGSPSSNGMLSLAARIDPMVPSNNTLSPPPAPIPSHSSSQVFPSTPTQTALCRYGLRCTNPACEYSHPTPAAARRGISGSNGNEAAVDEPLVLSESACRFGSRCTNKECTYSHPSPAISFLASKARGGTSNAGLPSLQSSAGEIPCRFQAACTNAGCPYAHFDENGNVGPSPALSGLARAVPISAASLATGTERGMDVDEDVDFDLTGTPPTEGASTTSGSSAAKAGGEWTNTSTGPGKLAALDLALGSSMGKGIGGGDMSGKRCRFGAACTRADCVFGHPPNRRVPPGSGYGSGSGAGAGGNSSGQAPCRFGAGCTRGEYSLAFRLLTSLYILRILTFTSMNPHYSFLTQSADCYFSHPPNRILPISSGSGSGGKAPHISERLKRFAGDGSADNGDGGEGEVERIIPGQAVETST